MTEMCQENSNNYWQLANAQEAAGKHSNLKERDNARVVKAVLGFQNTRFEYWRKNRSLYYLY